VKSHIITKKIVTQTTSPAAKKAGAMSLVPWSKAAISAMLTLVLMMMALPGFAQQPTALEHAAMLKATLAASQVVLRQYEWIETTVVSLKGEEKSRKQERCYYGADGGVQKVVLSQSAPPPKKRGLFRRKIAENKQAEMTEYMKNAVNLVKNYLPLDPVKIQAAKDAGKVSVEILDPGKRARLVFRDYVRAGDNLGVEVDLANNRPLGINVNSWLEEPKDVVTLQVRMAQLNDGTTYNSGIQLNAKSKNVTVAVTNSGYRKLTP
jgi:hypothetical protein